MSHLASLFDTPLAPVPWHDPFFYISIMIIVAFGAQIVYNLWNNNRR